MDRVSVVVPVHNGARYVGDAIRSVLAQTHTDLEVLVIDDGSQDETAAVVAAIDDHRVRLLRQEQAGVSVARNRGIREATADLVAFLDHDDLWHPDKLASQLPMFADDQVGLVGAFMTYLTDRGPVSAASGEDPVGQEERLRIADLLPFPLSSMVFRTGLLRELGGFDVDFAQAEDLDLVSRAARVTKIRAVTRSLGYYRLHRSATSFRTFGPMQDRTRFLRARIAAADTGDTLRWEDWSRSTKTSLSTRRTDKANYFYRSGGFQLMSGRPVRGIIALVSAALFSPLYVFTRLARQHKAAQPSPDCQPQDQE